MRMENLTPDSPEDPIAAIIDAYFGDETGPDFDAAITELVAAGMPCAEAKRALRGVTAERVTYAHWLRRHRTTRDGNPGEQVDA